MHLLFPIKAIKVLKNNYQLWRNAKIGATQYYISIENRSRETVRVLSAEVDK